MNCQTEGLNYSGNRDKLLKTKEKEKKMKRTMKSESGRSMVEMLGVLAIIGVLSIGGIAGYTMAMNRFRANEALDIANKYASLVFAGNQTLLARTGSGYTEAAANACDTDAPDVRAIGLVTEAAAQGADANTLPGGATLAIPDDGIRDDGVQIQITFTTEGVCDAALNILGGAVAGDNGRGTTDACVEGGGSITTFFRQSKLFDSEYNNYNLKNPTAL